MADNGIDILQLEVDIVDSELVVKPIYLFINQRTRDPGSFLELSLNCEKSAPMYISGGFWDKLRIRKERPRRNAKLARLECSSILATPTLKLKSRVSRTSKLDCPAFGKSQNPK
jgi:hypothetical protein